MSDKVTRVLFVDDDVVTGRVMQRNCDNAQYACKVFQNARECLKTFSTDGADLVITDLRMPGMNGFDLLSELRDIDQDVPILVMTGYSSVENAVEAMKRGASDFIKKPFNRVELLARVKSALRFIQTNKLFIELEKINTFSATVKKTNHEIKQPLTLINLSVTALKRELESSAYSKESAMKRIEFIEAAVKDILSVMHLMTKIKEPEVREYLENLKANEFKIGEVELPSDKLT